MIRTIIIDDEKNCCEVLAALLERYCPGISIEGIYHSAADALPVLQQNNAQLVFLDVEMPHMNGFDMLEKLSNIAFQIIFTTSYDQYAIRAIRFSALDYLLKPVDREELQAAVRKAVLHTEPALPQQLALLLNKLHQPSRHADRIALPTMEGLQLIPVASIISCASSSNYTALHLKENQKLIVSRTLKEIEEVLHEYLFLRVHHSYLVNLNEIRTYIKGEGGHLVMSDGTTIDVSRSRKDDLMKRLQPGKY